MERRHRAFAKKSRNVINLLNRLLRAYKLGSFAHCINKFDTLPGFLCMHSNCFSSFIVLE
jgi:hypothetical protein